ncbi:hypothetical protein [Lysobacter enzymogenes]|uniref:hypothetical protein n=1 Tax=Lysobacter enzymogenes TaxID=69 RepID=UPI0019CF73EB|nr:hypothetical protein [Lysobacter enzymogenes]
MTHGADTGSYTYDKSKIAVAGATGALGSMGGAVVDKAAGPALNALQKAAAPEAPMVIVKTVVDKAVDKANGVSPGPGHAHQLKKK